MRLVAVSGVDGSGKSTFIREVRRLLQDADPTLEVATAWLRFNPRASVGPVAASSVVSTLDERHRGHPAKRVARSLGLGRGWARLTARLYERQLRWQLSALAAHDVVLADRFVLDYVADCIGARTISEDRAVELLRMMPQADALFVLTASDATLASRRDPQENLDGLRRRRDLYERLARMAGATVIDTLEPGWQERVLEALRTSVLL